MYVSITSVILCHMFVCKCTPSNTLIIMLTSVIFQCLREGRNNFKCILVMNCHKYPSKRCYTSYVALD